MHTALERICESFFLCANPQQGKRRALVAKAMTLFWGAGSAYSQSLSFSHPCLLQASASLKAKEVAIQHIAALQQQVAEQQTHIDDQQATLRKKQLQLEDLSTQLAAQQAKLEDYAVQMADQQAAVAAATDAGEKLQQQVQEQQQQLGVQQQQLEEQQQDMMQQKQQLEQQEVQLQEREAAAAEASEVCTQLQQQLEHSQLLVAQQQQQLQEREAALAAASRSSAQLQQQLQAKDEELKDLTAKVNRAPRSLLTSGSCYLLTEVCARVCDWQKQGSTVERERQINWASSRMYMCHCMQTGCSVWTGIPVPQRQHAAPIIHQAAIGRAPPSCALWLPPQLSAGQLLSCGPGVSLPASRRGSRAAGSFTDAAPGRAAVTAGSGTGPTGSGLTTHISSAAAA